MLTRIWKKPTRVGVAEVEVLQAGLHEGGHDGELWRQVALLGLLGHPGGELLPGRVVARVCAADRREVDRGRGRVRRGRRRGGDACGLLVRLHGLQEQGRVAARLLLPGRRPGPAGGGDLAGPATAANRPDALFGSGGGGAGAAAGAPATGAAAAAAAAAGRLRRSGRQLRRDLEVRRDLLLEPDVDVVLVRRVGEVAGTVDRERRPDLVRADAGSNCDSSDATSRASALPGLTISPSIEAMSRPRPNVWLETDPPAVRREWSLHMQETTILCSWLSLVDDRDDPRVDRARP